MEKIDRSKIVSVHGMVNMITIVTDIDIGLSKGYGFIMMNDDAGAQRAIMELDGASIGERRISERLA